MKALFVICLIALIICGLVGVTMWLDVKNGCLDYLKLAADASSLSTMDDFLGKALVYIDERGLTQGNSGIFFHTPRTDFANWYRQLTDAKKISSEALVEINQHKRPLDDMTKVFISNTLIKIRETLVDASGGGTSVTAPPNICWYPHQVLMFWWLVLGILGFLVFGIIVLIEVSN